MDQVTDQLIDLLKEKWIVKDILDMKYEMEHKENMRGICNLINDMTCVVLNTVNRENSCSYDNIYEAELVEGPIQTHLIFHEKIEVDIQMDESVENYVFAFQPHEMNQYRYITRTIEDKGELYLNKEEYLSLYDVELTSETDDKFET